MNVELAVVAFRSSDVILSADLSAVARKIVVLFAAAERVLVLVVGAIQEWTYFAGARDCLLQ